MIRFFKKDILTRLFSNCMLFSFLNFCQSNNSVTASKLSSLSGIKVTKWKEHTHAATSKIQIESGFDKKACGPGNYSKKHIQEQHDEQKPANCPRLTLKGPYTGHLTVNTPARCLPSSCNDFSLHNDHENEETVCFKHIDLSYSSFMQSNIDEQVMNWIKWRNEL